MFPYITHPSATRCIATTVQLACFRPAASVRSEPGSNSHIYYKSCPVHSISQITLLLVSLLTETLQKLTNIIYSYTLSRLHSHALDARLFRLEQPSVHLFFLPIHTLFNILAPSGA